MKSVFTLFLFFVSFTAAFTQNAYIQVNGEPNLFVYLDNNFKGKTTIELKGLIIEKVTAGKHLITIVKEGYLPFEEHIQVKGGEVLSYDVKPFKKQVVSISEEGNVAETGKTVSIKTGKLIIQSLPIQIKITIPKVDGVKDMSKSKDQWTANDLPEGKYQISFKFNDKIITKNIEIIGDNTTSLFINMLSGEFTERNTLADRVAEENLLKSQIAFVKDFCNTYHFIPGISEGDFAKRSDAIAKLMSKQYRKDRNFYIDLGIRDLKTGASVASFKNGKLIYLVTRPLTSKVEADIDQELATIINTFKQKIDPKHFTLHKSGVTIKVPGAPSVVIIKTGGYKANQLEMTFSGNNTL